LKNSCYYLIFLNLKTYLLNLKLKRIFPFESGENSLQYYNSIFSLSWVQKFADIIYCFSNKEILDIFTNIKSSKNYSLNDINSFISDCASSLYPFGNKKLISNLYNCIIQSYIHIIYIYFI